MFKVFLSCTCNQRIPHSYNFVTRCFTNTQDNYMAIMLLMNGGRYKMHQCKRMVYILISIVINVNLGIHNVLNLNYSFLQPKIMEKLLKFLPTTFKVLNGVWKN